MKGRIKPSGVGGSGVRVGQIRDCSGEKSGCGVSTVGCAGQADARTLQERELQSTCGNGTFLDTLALSLIMTDSFSEKGRVGGNDS